MAQHQEWRSNAASTFTLDTDEYDSDKYPTWDERSTQTISAVDVDYSKTKPLLRRHDTCLGRMESRRSGEIFGCDIERMSVETYASTEPSEPDDGDELAFELLDLAEDECRSDAIPATPSDFAELFPSARRLSISHDDSTLDGNMNLRVDTSVETEWCTGKENLTLFHLKINDLRSRDMSLRRYCRDSGREVCKTIRKEKTKHRPTLAKSLSSAFSTVIKRNDHNVPQMHHLQRNDSGYESVFAHSFADDAGHRNQKEGYPASDMVPSNTIKFEFSNYANVELTRQGAGASKGYKFEYWGHDYTWRRSKCQDGQFEEVSFQLLRKDKVQALAHIVPVPLTKQQARDEAAKGGWIPPCSLWITDPDILDSSMDHADLVVATGLVALVDDAIKRRWHSETHQHILLPLLHVRPLRLNVEFIGPKRLIDEVFNSRPKSKGSERAAGIPAGEYRQ